MLQYNRKRGSVKMKPACGCAKIKEIGKAGGLRMDEKPEQVQKRFLELAERAYQNGTYTFTPFLGLQEQSVFHGMARALAHVPWEASGGMEGCERKLVRFGSEALCGYVQPFPIACVAIRPGNAKFAEQLTHRDFLGALMGLGVERDTLGDIVVREKEAYVFCLARIAPFLVENLSEVRRTRVRCSIAEALPEGALFRVEEKTVQVASVRADALCAHVWNLSRGDSLALFQAGRVFLNGRLCENGAAALREGDVLSVRGHGRFIFRGVRGMTKKGRCNALVEVYV